MWEEFNEALIQASHRVVTGIADFLPGVLAMLTALVIAFPVAWMAGAMVRRSLTRLRFDERLVQWGFSTIADWAPYGSTTTFLSRLTSWVIVLFGFLVGLTALDASLTSAMTMRAFGYVPDVVAAIVVLLVGNFVARFLARSVLITAVNMQLQSARLISLGVKWLILVLTGAMALEHIGIGGEIVRMAFGITFGGIVLAMALAVGLGSKDLVSRSWERHQEKDQEEDESLRHL